MAAYAAVVSLHHTINGLLNSSYVSVSSSREMLELAYKEASSLLQVLEGLNGSNRSRSSMERVDALEAQIRDAAHKLEDVLEFRELEQQLEEEEEVMGQEIRSFGKAGKRLEEEYLAELSGDEDDEDTTTDSSYIDFGVEMIGRSHLFDTVLQDVLKRMRPDDRYVWAFWGEQGSGSRLVVKTVYESTRKAGKFERWGWVRVGRGYELKHVLMSLISQVEAHIDDGLLIDASEDRLSEYLYKALENRRYMIVLDGVDEAALVDYVKTKSFPDQGNGSLVLLTTNSREEVVSSDTCCNFVLTDIYEEEFWLCIHHTIFGGESIPAELEVVGKEIVHNCRCLYISVAKTLVFLSKSDKTVEQWSKLAADKENPIFTVADEISEGGDIQKRDAVLQNECCSISLGIGSPFFSS